MEHSAGNVDRFEEFLPASCRYDRLSELALVRFISMLFPSIVPAVDSLLSHDPCSFIPEGRDISTTYLLGLANPIGNLFKKFVMLALISAIIILL